MVQNRLDLNVEWKETWNKYLLYAQFVEEDDAMPPVRNSHDLALTKQVNPCLVLQRGAPPVYRSLVVKKPRIGKRQGYQ